MALRQEKQLGPSTNVNPLAATTYTNIYTVPASTTSNVVLMVTNRSTGSVKARSYVAGSGWTTGEPATTNLVAAVIYDRILGPGESYATPYPFLMSAGQKLVCWAESGSSLDFLASGVEIT